MSAEGRPVYLDCNATTPVDPRVVDVVMHYMTLEMGNAGSRTHVFGAEAARAVNTARAQVANVVNVEPASVVFTSGATESNNLAILGLEQHGLAVGRCHIVSSGIEHHAVLGPVEHLRARGFEVTLVAPKQGGWVDPADVAMAMRPDTLLVSIMHVNNETGVIQPLDEITELLANHEAYLHTDASQGFGKELALLRNPRLDLISLSGHKLFAPKGIGALVIRRRGYRRPPLAPLTFGGGQERGLRPGTLPVHLIAGIGKAAELALAEQQIRWAAAEKFKRELLAGVATMNPVLHGDQGRVLPSTLNLSFPGVDSEAAILALKDVVAVSNGSACTSTGHEPSHVLRAMGLPTEHTAGAIRMSWCHLTPIPDYRKMCAAITALL